MLYVYLRILQARDTAAQSVAAMERDWLGSYGVLAWLGARVHAIFLFVQANFLAIGLYYLRVN